MNKLYRFITVWDGKNQTQTSHIKSKWDFIKHVECNKNKYVEQCNFYLRSKKPKNSYRVQFSNIIDTIASNETHIARFDIYMSLPIKSIVAQFIVE